MPKPVESASPNRPLKTDSMGREVTLTATIVYPGSCTSDVMIGERRVQLPNAILREASGEPDL